MAEQRKKKWYQNKFYIPGLLLGGVIFGSSLIASGNTNTIEDQTINTPTIQATSKPTVIPTLAATIPPTKPILPTRTPTKSIAPTARPTKVYVAPTALPPAQSGGMSCNCSLTCPQMNSCAEAQFQLNSCGCSARDADNDGIACDREPLNCQN